MESDRRRATRPPRAPLTPRPLLPTVPHATQAQCARLGWERRRDRGVATARGAGAAEREAAFRVRVRRNPRCPSQPAPRSRCSADADRPPATSSGGRARRRGAEARACTRWLRRPVGALESGSGFPAAALATGHAPLARDVQVDNLALVVDHGGGCLVGGGGRGRETNKEKRVKSEADQRRFAVRRFVSRAFSFSLCHGDRRRGLLRAVPVWL